jgi:hypothetical protein
MNIEGQKSLFWHPARMGKCPSEPSPSVSVTISAISIDLTSISINLAASYDEEGVVLPQG